MQLFSQLCHPLYRLEEIIVFPYIVMKLAFETKVHISTYFPFSLYTGLAQLRNVGTCDMIPTAGSMPVDFFQELKLG